MDALQVLAEPRRRQILALIWEQELPAATIAGQFEVTFGAISQHLQILRRAGFVTVRKEGNRRLYSVDQDVLEPFKEALELMWRGTLGNLAAHIETMESSSK